MNKRTTTATDSRRSEIMRAVKSKDTKPEVIVRSLVHRLGYRFRLHRKDIPGTPDIAFPGRHKVIFIHGCFWHGHDCKRGSRVPKANRDYWEMKIERNKRRDAINVDALKQLQWQILVIWECEITDSKVLTRRLSDFLNCG
jgi:DNA mismatch endonuclease, patch repair protein